MKDIASLRLFIEVARRLSFSETARHLNLPTTTVSRKVQLLESELNTKLFHRTTRSISLTEMGQRILSKAKLMVEISEEMNSEIEQHISMPSGRLHITAATTILEQITPLLAEFVKEHGHITFNLESGSRYVDLAERGIDFAFRLGPLADSSLISFPVAPLKYVLVANTVFLKDHSRPVHPSDLQNLPCIRSEIDGMLFPWHFLKDQEVYNHESENFVLSNDLRVCAQMVINGYGIAYLPERLVEQELKEGVLSPLLEEWIPVPRTLHLVYSNREHLPSKSKAFIEFIRSNRARLEKAINNV